MSNQSKVSKEVEDTLRSVIQSLIDSQDGFKKIGEQLKGDAIKRYFLAESLKRASFRGEVENLLHSEGVHDLRHQVATW
jgi:hypothetical protein